MSTAVDVITTARRIIAETGSPIPWEIVAAQWALESGFGKSAPNGNPFGHKASSGTTPGAKLLKTTEVFTPEAAAQFLKVQGRTLKALKMNDTGSMTYYEAQDWFIAYDSLDDAVRGHLRILGLQRYRTAIKNWPSHGDVGRLATEIAAAGYATLNAKLYGERVAKCWRDPRMVDAIAAALAGPQTLGQIAYRAFGADDSVFFYNGQPWALIPADLRGRWNAAAEAVRKQLEENKSAE
jgi:hypothetical protein